MNLVSEGGVLRRPPLPVRVGLVELAPRRGSWLQCTVREPWRLPTNLVAADVRPRHLLRRQSSAASLRRLQGSVVQSAKPWFGETSCHSLVPIPLSVPAGQAGPGTRELGPVQWQPVPEPARGHSVRLGRPTCVRTLTRDSAPCAPEGGCWLTGRRSSLRKRMASKGGFREQLHSTTLASDVTVPEPTCVPGLE